MLLYSDKNKYIIFSAISEKTQKQEKHQNCRKKTLKPEKYSDNIQKSQLKYHELTTNKSNERQ